MIPYQIEMTLQEEINPQMINPNTGEEGNINHPTNPLEQQQLNFQPQPSSMGQISRHPLGSEKLIDMLKSMT
jgi:hypothetical protein